MVDQGRGGRRVPAGYYLASRASRRPRLRLNWLLRMQAGKRSKPAKKRRWSGPAPEQKVVADLRAAGGYFEHYLGAERTGP